MYLEHRDDESVICVDKKELYDSLIRAETHVPFEPKTIALQLFGYMSDNDDTQLKCDIEDFIENPKRFVQNYIEDILDLTIEMGSMEKYMLLHLIEGELHAELMKRNLIKRAWIANV